MNDSHSPCEQWMESISLAAAGCLSDDEEMEVRTHLETCSCCRERFRELAGLCERLEESLSPVNAPDEVTIPRIIPRHEATDRRQRHSQSALFFSALALAAACVAVLLLPRLDLKVASHDIASNKIAIDTRDSPVPSDFTIPTRTSESPTLLNYELALSSSGEQAEQLFVHEAQRLSRLLNRSTNLSIYQELGSQP